MGMTLDSQGAQYPHRILVRGRCESQSETWTGPPAGCDEGGGATRQGHGTPGSWKGQEMALPGALGWPGPPGCSPVNTGQASDLQTWKNRCTC